MIAQKTGNIRTEYPNQSVEGKALLNILDGSQSVSVSTPTLVYAHPDSGEIETIHLTDDITISEANRQYMQLVRRGYELAVELFCMDEILDMSHEIPL